MWVLKVSQLTDKLKNQSESNKQAQDNLHEQVQEQKTLLRSAQDRAHTLETSVSELTTQLADSKEKVSQLDAQVKSLRNICLKTYSENIDITLLTGPKAACPTVLILFIMSITVSVCRFLFSWRQRQRCCYLQRLPRLHRKPTWRTTWRQLSMHCRTSSRLAPFLCPL